MDRAFFLRSLGGLILLGGIIFLTVTGGFWPWILAVVGVSVLPMAFGRGSAPLIGSMIFAATLTALAAMIEFDWLWPGLLLLIVALFGVRFVALSVRGRRR
jgi:hypothetical protein